MNILEIIDKKRNNQELTYEEIKYAFNSYLNEEVKDYQMSSLLMAITINGMTQSETNYLTKVFIESGEIYELSKLSADKHSTGGVGDSTTLIVTPIVASMNIPVAKMSGRSLGFTGGTIDKLESIPGMKVDLSKDEFFSILEKAGMVISSQTNDLTPLDSKIYNLRDVTGTANCLPLIAASIMSKKIAAGAHYIVIDVKYGKGALLKDIKQAEEFSLMVTEIGNFYEKDIRCVLNNMNSPLSLSVGNALEVMEALEVLQGKDNKLKDTSVDLAAEIVSMAKKISKSDAIILCKNALDKKSAYNTFVNWVKIQGGDLEKLQLSKKEYLLKSSEDSVIKDIDALKVAKLSFKLGSLKENKESQIDYGSGVKILKKINSVVTKGEVLAKLYTNKDNIQLTEEDLNIFKT